MISPVLLTSTATSAARTAAATTTASSSLSSISLFTRYVFAVQYHGGNFLGFTYQGQHGEDCVVYNKNESINIHKSNKETQHKMMVADLRGIESVEGRIRKALDKLVGANNYTNIQVSSRTDRGVHAWRNTFQVDVRPRGAVNNVNDENSATDDAIATSARSSNHLTATVWCPKNLVNGLNFYLNRLSNRPSTTSNAGDNDENDSSASNCNESQIGGLTKKRQRYRTPTKAVQFNDTPILHRHNQTLNSAVRILSSAIAPDVTIPNKRHNPNLPECKINNPKDFPWDVRLTATRRTYAYRILHSFEDEGDDGDTFHSRSDTSGCYEFGEELHRNDATITVPNSHSSTCYDSHPFEHDRVWRIHEKETRRRYKSTKQNIVKGLDIDAMNHAAKYLVGTHDFSSFRGKGCQRSSPIVTLEDVWIDQERYHDNDGHGGGILSAVWNRRRHHEVDNKMNGKELPVLHINPSLHLITIVITGQSFLYRQVRNMVACLVDVGRGKLQPDRVKEILEKRDRRYASGMAPAQGLFLVDVEHGEIKF
jgi:tRNA pseudouridine(38-40) synthase